MGRPCLRGMLASIREHTVGIPYEVVLVVPKSACLSLDLLETFNPIVLYEENSRGCVRALNQGLRAARGTWVANLNDDCEVCPDWLANMLKAVEGQEVVGAFAYHEPGIEGFVTQSLWGLTYANFFFAAKVTLERLNYLDEGFTHYGFDPDFSMSAWHHGISVIPVMEARVIHHCLEDEHRKEYLRAADCERMWEKWRGIFWGIHAG